MPPLVHPWPAPAGPVRPALYLGAPVRRRQARHGRAFALVMPSVSTEAMRCSSTGSAANSPGRTRRHGRRQAGWHVAIALRVPNVTLVLLPPYSPELNPVERLWLYLRERHRQHRLLEDYDAIVAALCQAWNQLTPERISSRCNYPYIQQVSL